MSGTRQIVDGFDVPAGWTRADIARALREHACHLILDQLDDPTIEVMRQCIARKIGSGRP